MRDTRWWPFALYADALITIWIGWSLPWVESTEPDHVERSWRNGHPVSNISAAAWMLESLLVTGMFVWLAYSVVAVIRKRLGPPAAEIRACAIATAILAVIGLVGTVYMTIITYGYARDWSPPGEVERAAQTIRASVTFAPWLALAGFASFLVAGVWLARVVKRLRS